jgi:hypothetical protein
MPEFEKPSGKRCQHQRAGTGCNIYPRRPQACRLWNCRWLAGHDTGARPDHCHYVVDMLPDYVTLVMQDGEKIEVPVVQVWLDPRYPDAHRDKKLRAFLDRERITALIRLNERDGFLLAPPSVNADGAWFEGQKQTKTIERTHTPAERLEHMGPLTMQVELDPNDPEDRALLARARRAASS